MLGSGLNQWDAATEVIAAESALLSRRARSRSTISEITAWGRSGNPLRFCGGDGPTRCAEEGIATLALTGRR